MLVLFVFFFDSLSRVQLFCDSMDCGPPGSCVHGISQARILEWVAISFSTGSSQPRDQTHVSCVSCSAGRFFTTEPPGKPVAEWGGVGTQFNHVLTPPVLSPACCAWLPTTSPDDKMASRLPSLVDASRPYHVGLAATPLTTQSLPSWSLQLHRIPNPG